MCVCVCVCVCCVCVCESASVCSVCSVGVSTTLIFLFTTVRTIRSNNVGKTQSRKKSFRFHFISEFCEAQNGRVDNQPMRILATK